VNTLLVKEVRIVDADHQLVGDILSRDWVIPALGRKPSLPRGVPVLQGKRE